MFRSGNKHIWLGVPRDSFFTWGLVASALQGLSAVALLAVSAWLISRAAEVTSIVYLGIAIVGVRGFAVGRATFRYSERLLLHESAFRMLASIRPVLFSKVAPFIPAGMVQAGRGETMAKIVNDVDALQNLSLRVIAPLVQSIVVAAASVVFMWMLLPASGFALLLILIAAFFVAIPVSARLARASDVSESPTKAQMANLSLDLLENLDVYIAYGWIDSKRVEIAQAENRLQKSLTNSAVSNGLGSALFALLSTLAVLSGAFFGGTAVIGQVLPGATLAVFVLLPLAIFEVVQNAQPTLSALRKFKVSSGRVTALLEREVPSALRFESGEGKLETFESIDLRSVSVTYPASPQPSLVDFDLSFKLGDSLMIIGESGAGKSTLALLLTRLIQPSSGEFLINGKPAGVFDPDAVRRIVGLVEQNPMVFLGDVRANLEFAKPGASDEELRNVLTQVGLWSMFVEREGLDTQLGDRGVLISGGEAQRLALARAILADFKVFILDEPTANVDSDTAKALLSDLLRIAKGAGERTVLLISHEQDFRRLVDRTVEIVRR